MKFDNILFIGQVVYNICVRVVSDLQTWHKVAAHVVNTMYTVLTINIVICKDFYYYLILDWKRWSFTEACDWCQKGPIFSRQKSCNQNRCYEPAGDCGFFS